MENNDIIEEQFYLHQDKIENKITETKEYKLEKKNVKETETLLKNCTNEADHEVVDNFIKYNTALTNTKMKEAFIYGYSLANKIMINSLIKK